MSRPESLPSIRLRVHHLIAGVEADRTTTHGVENLFFQLAYKAYPGERPPEFVQHVAQVAVVSDELLTNTDQIEREWGKRYAFGHDIGRSVDLGPDHTMAGARILYEYGFQSPMITYTLAHHRWGLGIPLLGPDDFPVRVEDALKNGHVLKVMDEIIEKRGLAALAVLLADNSKRPIHEGAYETEITAFNEPLADHLIEAQIARHRYERDSQTHKIERLGAHFLVAIIPHLEKKLHIRYASDGSGDDVITRARARWQKERVLIFEQWRRLHDAQTTS